MSITFEEKHCEVKHSDDEIIRNKFGVLFLSSILLFSLLFGIFSIHWIGKINEIGIYFLSFTLLPILNVLILRYIERHQLLTKVNNRFLERLLLALFFGFIAIALQGSSKIAYELNYLMKSQIVTFPRFIKGFLGCALILSFFILFAYKPNFLQLSVKFKKQLHTFFGVIAVFALLGTLDARMVLDSISYGPYLGPALSLLHGGIPYLDVFSQYGTSYILFAAIIAISHYSIPAVVGLVSVVNTLLYTLYTLIALRLCKNKILALFVALLSVYFVINAYIFNITTSPSVMGMRFLPLYLLIYTLIKHETTANTLNNSSIAILLLCSIHSIEMMIFGTLASGVYLLILNRINQRAIQNLFKHWVYIATLVILPHFILSVIFLSIWKQWPRYDIYFEILRSYSDLNMKIWFYSVDFSVKLWLLFGFVYLVSLSVCIYWIYNKSIGKEAPKNVVSLTMVTVLGILQFAYYIGRATPTLLGTVALPCCLILLCAFDWGLSQLKLKKRNLSVNGLILSIFLLFCLMSAVFVDKFGAPFRPLSQKEGESFFHSVNSCLLRAAIHYHFRIDTFANIKKVFISSQPFCDCEHYQSESYFQAKEAYFVSQSLKSPMKQFIPLFMDTPLYYFHARKKPIYHSSNFINDAWSKSLTQQILGYAKTEMQENEILLLPIIPTIQTVELQIKEQANKNWKFCKIQTPEAKMVTAVQLCQPNRVCLTPRALRLSILKENKHADQYK